MQNNKNIQNPNHIIQTIPTNKIIEFLNERGIKLSVNDIISPKLNTIEQVYVEILTFLNISIPTTSSNYQLTLFFIIKNLLKGIGTQTFKFNDMFNINNTKFSFYLSQLINFISHKESIKYLFDDIEIKLNELNEEKINLENNIKEKEKILKSINVQEIQNIELKSSIINKIEEYKILNKQYKDNIATLMMEYKEIKKLKDSAMTTNSEKKMLILNLKKEKENLNNLIVNDKSIERDLIFYRSEIPKLRNEIESLNQKLHENNEKIIISDSENKELNRIYGSLLELEKMDFIIIDLKNKKIDLKMKNNNLIREVDFLTSKRETNKKQILQIEEEKKNLQKNALRFSKEFKILMNDLRNQIDMQKNESSETKKEKEKIQNEINKFKHICEEKNNLIKSIELKIKEQVQLLKSEIERFNIEGFESLL